MTGEDPVTASENAARRMFPPVFSATLTTVIAFFGLTAIGAVQWFEARGVGSFAPFSTNPAALSNNDKSYSYGAGVRVGYLGNLSPYFSVGASYQTKIWMSKFDDYAGLFAEQGGFDIPANWVIGIAIKPTENLDIVLDVQQELYGDIPSIANPLLPALGACGMGDSSSCLGADQGSGFGWRDMTTVKAGEEWSVVGEVRGKPMTIQLKLDGFVLSGYRVLVPSDKDEADVVWRLDMMEELGVRHHI